MQNLSTASRGIPSGPAAVRFDRVLNPTVCTSRVKMYVRSGIGDSSEAEDCVSVLTFLRQQAYILRVNNRAVVLCLRPSCNNFVYSIPPTLRPSSMFAVYIAYSPHLVVEDKLIDPCL